MRICANTECGLEFEPTAHNQIYHTQECTRIATNKKIMERYYERKEKKLRIDRVCLICGNKLSRYNDGEEDYCLIHQTDRSGISKNDLFDLLGFKYESD